MKFKLDKILKKSWKKYFSLVLLLIVLLLTVFYIQYRVNLNSEAAFTDGWVDVEIKGEVVVKDASGNVTTRFTRKTASQCNGSIASGIVSGKPNVYTRLTNANSGKNGGQAMYTIYGKWSCDGYFEIYRVYKGEAHKRLPVGLAGSLVLKAPSGYGCTKVILKSGSASGQVINEVNGCEMSYKITKDMPKNLFITFQVAPFAQ